jgi:hypothetical protein
MIRKISKIVAIAAVVAFGAIQFVRPDFGGTPVVETENLLANADLDPLVRQVLVRSCADCHSNETAYPWYSHITPFNWFLAGHVDEGRHELNLSKWNTYTTDQKRHKLDEIYEQVEAKWMPLPSYLWIHRDAALSDSERTLLLTWAKAESERLPAP